MIKVKIKQMKDGRHPLPKYAHKGDAGMDFYAYLERTATINPGARSLIPLGVAVSIPEGYELQLRPRSGLALNKGITLNNAIGTIDESFRGELCAIVINHSKDVVAIEDGMKICQGVFNKFEEAKLEEVTSLDETERADGGFGSTGI